MTGAIVFVTVAVYVVELLAPNRVIAALGYNPGYSVPSSGLPFEPWRMLTVLLVHSPASLPYNVLPLTHIGFNMYALYLFGRQLEDVVGGVRLLVLYLLAGLGGSVAVLYAALAHLLNDPFVVGASGAVFGVFGAVFVVQRRLRVDANYLLVLIGINLVLGFVLPGVAWQAHVGGLVTGALVGWVLVANRGPRRVRRQLFGISAIAALLLGLTALPLAL